MRILRKIFGLHPVAFLLVCLVPAVLIANLTSHTEALLDALLLHIDTDADGNITDESPSYVAVTVGTEAYDATGWDADLTVPTKDAVRDKIEAIPTGGDITTVLSDETGDVVRLFQTAAAFVDADATPDVSGGTVFITANTGATTITDFDTSLVDGHMIFIIVNDANTTFDLTSSGLEGTGGKDYAAANGDLVIAVYSTTDSQWHMIFWPSTIGAVSLQEGITWTDGDGTGSLAWAFAFGAARTITIPGDADQTLVTLSSTNAFTGPNDFGGATGLELPNGTNPTVDATGEAAIDTDGANEAGDLTMRVFDGTNTVALGRKLHCIQATAIKPQDWADTERDLFPFWANNTGMVFTITEIKAWSDTDDTTVTVELVPGTDWSTPSAVDALEIATDGTSVFTDTQTTITDATVAHDEILTLDFDDTDDPGVVKVCVCGWFNGAID